MNDNTLTQDQYDLYLSIVDEYEKLRPLSDDEKYELIEQIATSSYIDLLCDWAFKHVFGYNEENLMMLLNDFLPERIMKVEEVHFTPNAADPFKGDDKHVLMDVMCRLEDGRSIIVEMQKSNNREFRNRMFYYGASMVSRQLKKGDSYRKLKPVYVICFMNFRTRHKTNQLVYRYQLREQESGESYGNQLSVFFCELPRFVPKPRKDLSPIEEWFDILRNMRTFAQKPKDINQRFNSIFDACRQNVLDPTERIQYFKAMISEEEKQGIAEAYREEGWYEGHEAGKTEGKAEERESMLAALRAAGASEELLATALKIANKKSL